MVCEAHLDLFRVVDTTLRKNTKCDGCNKQADRVANWRSSVILSLVHGIRFPIGAPICPQCYKTTAEGVDELMGFIEDEHRFSVCSKYAVYLIRDIMKM